MDSLYIRNYLVVAAAGMFCLLNANIVSAQTATDKERQLNKDAYLEAQAKLEMLAAEKREAASN